MFDSQNQDQQKKVVWNKHRDHLQVCLHPGIFKQSWDLLSCHFSCWETLGLGAGAAVGNASLACSSPVSFKATNHFPTLLVKNAHKVCLQTPGRGMEVFSDFTVIFLSFYLTQSYFSCLLPFVHLRSTYHSPPAGGFISLISLP